MTDERIERPNSFGYVYHNPDTGTEWAEQHPIDSGEVPDATDIQAADLAVLHSNLMLAWQGNAILRTEKHADAEAIAAMQKDAAMDRLVAEGQRCEAMTPQEAAKVLLRELEVFEPVAPGAKLAVFTWLRNRAISEDSHE